MLVTFEPHTLTFPPAGMIWPDVTALEAVAEALLLNTSITDLDLSGAQRHW